VEKRAAVEERVAAVVRAAVEKRPPSNSSLANLIR
jgi:hypothetical protein